MMKSKRLTIIISVVLVLSALFVLGHFPLWRQNYTFSGKENINGDIVCLSVDGVKYAHLYQFEGYRYGGIEEYEDENLDKENGFQIDGSVFGLYLLKYPGFYFKDKTNGLFIATDEPRGIGEAAPHENIYYEESIKLPELSLDDIECLEINGQTVKNPKEIQNMIDKIRSGETEEYVLDKYGSYFEKDDGLMASFRFRNFNSLWFLIGLWSSNEGEPWDEFVCDYRR